MPIDSLICTEINKVYIIDYVGPQVYCFIRKPGFGYVNYSTGNITSKPAGFLIVYKYKTYIAYYYSNVIIAITTKNGVA